MKGKEAVPHSELRKKFQYRDIWKQLLWATLDTKSTRRVDVRRVVGQPFRELGERKQLGDEVTSKATVSREFDKKRVGGCFSVIVAASEFL